MRSNRICLRIIPRRTVMRMIINWNLFESQRRIPKKIFKVLRRKRRTPLHSPNAYSLRRHLLTSFLDLRFIPFQIHWQPPGRHRIRRLRILLICTRIWWSMKSNSLDRRPSLPPPSRERKSIWNVNAKRRKFSAWWWVVSFSVGYRSFSKRPSAESFGWRSTRKSSVS